MQAKKTNLEPERSTFVGRAADLAALGDLFSSGARLVTVVGPPGIGKTRLAREYVRQHSQTLLSRGEAWFCDLSAATDVHGICAVLGGALQIRLTSDTAAETVLQLGRALAARGETLLLLDNFEQVADKAPSTLGRWLELCPQTRFLVTSRETLPLLHGQLYELRPMSLPDRDEDALDSEAVQLFVERAARARPGFHPHPPDLPAIATVVRELDGLPLAIELAASRMGILTVQQLRSRLPARFVLLADSKRIPSGPIERQERQRTLEGAIRWSWRLLAERDQLALARCSAFRGGFTLEAAEAILGPEMPALDILQSLRDRSLLTSTELTLLPGENRFSLLNSIREYADHRLTEMGDRALAESRHTAFFLEHGQKLAAELEERPDFKSLRRLQLEADNLTAVLLRALAITPPTSQTAEIALRTLLSLDPVLQVSGPFSRHLEWLDAALSVPVPGQPSLWARALLCRAAVHRNEGHLGPSRRDYADALLLSRQTGDRRTEGRAHDGLGMLSVLFGQIPDARDHYEAALELFRGCGDRADEGLVLAHLGTLHRLGGEHAPAKESYQRALAVLRECGDQHSQCKVLTSLASVYTESGDAEEGLGLCQEALALAQATGDARAEDNARRHIADVHMMAGNLAPAEEHYSRCLTLMQQTGNRRLEGLVLGCLGVIRAEQGRYAEALERVTRTVQLFLDSGDRYHAGIFQSFRAGVLAALDRTEESESTFADAERVLDEIGAHVSLREGELYRCFLDLALARKALRDGDRPRAVAFRNEALAKLARAEAVEEETDPGVDSRAAAEGSFASSSARARIALRMLRAYPWPKVSDSSDPGASPTAHPIEADPEGNWFRTSPTAEPVSFARRKNLRRVFARLLESRLADPGHALTLQELLEAGWPGERVLPAAAANRVYVALATLRKMGLKEVLRSTDSGYFLDPAVPLVIPRTAPKI